MRLTNKDKNYLISIGYTNEDFSAIENATKNIKYSLLFISDNKKQEIKLNQKQAIGMLGRKTFLSGIGRATFHYSAVRSNEELPNIKIYFNRREN